MCLKYRRNAIVHCFESKTNLWYFFLLDSYQLVPINAFEHDISGWMLAILTQGRLETETHCVVSDACPEERLHMIFDVIRIATLTNKTEYIDEFHHFWNYIVRISDINSINLYFGFLIKQHIHNSEEGEQLFETFQRVMNAHYASLLNPNSCVKYSHIFFFLE